MNMFGKAFESMYTGSMFGSPALDFSVMGYVIACQRPRKGDGECFVELNPVLLAAMFRTSEQDVMECIERLCSPDPRSRSPEEEGRRLIAQTPDQKPAPGPTTYWVVNGKRYREMASEEERREYLRLAKQRERAAKKKPSTSVNKRRKPSTKSTQAEAEAEAEAESVLRGSADPPASAVTGRAPAPSLSASSLPDEASASTEASEGLPGGLGWKMRQAYSKRYRDLFARDPGSSASHGKALAAFTTWLRGEEARTGEDPEALGERVLDGLFASPRAREKRCPLTWVATDPGEFLEPQKGRELSFDERMAAEREVTS